MIDNGAGLINVPLNKWDKWNELISEFYLTGKMDKLKDWTYKNGIQELSFHLLLAYLGQLLIQKIMNNLHSCL